METLKLMATAAGAALLMAAGSAAAEDSSVAPFDRMVVFGDSLSDAGNLALASGSPVPLRFTTNPGLVTVEYVAGHYGLNLGASVAGGSDYAFGGSGVINNVPGSPPFLPTITAQVNGYLAAKPSLDPNGLYSYWGGANDIFYQASQVAGGLTSPTAAIGAITATGGASGALIGKLQSAGAGTIIVFNLPDVGRTPSAQAAEAVAPGSALLLTGMALGYNGALNQSLAGRHGIVPVNVYGFFNEVLLNPGLFGISNVTGTACTVASSLSCTPATLQTSDAASTYLFADGVHPTTAGHRALGDLVISELAAPQQMTLLAEAPLALISTGSLAVTDELNRRMDTPGTGVRVFASGGYANSQTSTQLTDVSGIDGDAYSVTGGVSMGFTDAFSAGLALTAGRNRVDWSGETGNFALDGVMLTAFAQYGFGPNAYLNVQGQAMQASYEVHRSFALGVSRRTEDADPDGWSAGVKVGAGYWFGGETWRTGPFVAGEYQHVRVEGFSEQGGDSTAMTFDSQNREALVGKVGWALKGTLDTGGTAVRPFASIAYAHDDKADRRYLTAGLVSLNGDFEMPGYKPERHWVEAGAGLSAEFNQRWGGQIAYSGHFANDSRELHAISVGLHAAF